MWICASFNVFSVIREWVGVTFLEKSITKVYGSMFLALWRSGWMSNFQKKHYKSLWFKFTTGSRYEGLVGCPIYRANHYKGVRYGLLALRGDGCMSISMNFFYKSAWFNVIIVLRGVSWCQISRKNITKVHGSTLLALRGGGWMSNFQKKVLRNTGMAS